MSLSAVQDPHLSGASQEAAKVMPNEGYLIILRHDYIITSTELLFHLPLQIPTMLISDAILFPKHLKLATLSGDVTK